MSSASPARVLTLFPRPEGGGAERLVFDQLRLHDPTRCDLCVVALRKALLDPEFRAYPDYACLNAWTPWSPRALAAVHRLIRRKRIEILHTHLQEADGYGYWLKRMNPGLVWLSTRHNTDDFRKRRFWRLLNRTMARRCDRVLAVSHSVKEFIARYEEVAADKITVVHNGVDVKRFVPTTLTVEAKASLGIQPGDFVVGIVGRLCQQKGHAYLFAAAARVRREIPGLRLLVVGKGGLRKSLEALALRLGIADRVSFAGYRKDPTALYAAMEVCCLPALFEGFGLVLVEAMACGCLVIGSRVDGIREIVEDGSTGFLAEPGDSESLARILVRVYRREYDDALVTRARHLVLSRFNLEKNLDRIADLYQEVLGRSAAR
jgi:glycosyltransferase involved in cell wall biosynthesis